MEQESKNRDITEEELNSLNRRELFAFKKESSALKFQTQGWRKKSVSESIFKKWTRDEHIKFVAGLKELGLSADSEVKDEQWLKLSQLVAASRSAYDVKLHARVFWQSPAAAAAEEKAASAGHKREFVQPSQTTEARKKQRPDSPEDEATALSPNNSAAGADDTMEAVLSGSLSLTSSMLGLYLSSASDDTPPSASPLTSPPVPSSSSSSSSAMSTIMPNNVASAFGFGDGCVGNMNDIMANQLLEENVQIITIIRENLVNGNIKINYSLMRKFAANISRILKWQSMQPVCAHMPPLPVKLNTSFLTSSTFLSSSPSASNTQQSPFIGTGRAPPSFPPVLASFTNPSTVTASPPSLFSSSSPSSASLSSSSSPPSLTPSHTNHHHHQQHRPGVNSSSPIVISPPSSPGLIFYSRSAFG